MLHATFRVLIVALFVSSAILVRNEAQSAATHSGKVVDWDSQKPLDKVWATAFESPDLETTDDCPSLKGKITADRTASNGEFSLGIPLRISDYHVQYCLEGYGGRRTHLRNEASGRRIEPDPVRILKKGSSSEAGQRRRISQVVQDLKQHRIGRDTANEEFAYLREVDSDGYDSALAKNEILLSHVKESGGPYPIVVAERKKKPDGWFSLIDHAFNALLDFFHQP